jgi:restriction system protein
MPGRFSPGGPPGGPFGFRSDFNPVPRRPHVASMQAFVERNNALLNTPSTPLLLLQAVIIPGDKTAEGQLIEAVTIPWFEIVELMARSPDTIYEIDWRKWEEIIAAAYKQQGFEVTLTPRSNDKGRDVIATKSGVGSVRFFDQVKAYRPGHVVTAEEVRAMVGVLTLQPNVSKGLVTTTSTFAPGILEDPDIARLTPYRLELKAKDALLDWLLDVAKNSRGA